MSEDLCEVVQSLALLDYPFEAGILILCEVGIGITLAVDAAYQTDRN